MLECDTSNSAGISVFPCMILSAISFRGVRNLQPDTIAPTPGLNLFIGDNGAGKSAFLEAVNLLTTARSFRSSRIRAAISWGEPGFLVSGRFQCHDSSNATAGDGICLQHRFDGKESRITLGSSNRLTRLELLSRFPSVFVGAESLKFFEDGPSFRRRQLDNGAFHVEHRYIASWRRYQRALAQRNALLRSATIPSPKSIAPWESELAASAQAMHRSRDAFCIEISDSIGQFSGQLGLPEGLSLRLRPGWQPGSDLAQQLDDYRERDYRAGYTLRGPHRDDLILMHQQRNALNAISRGQQKAFMLAYFLALAEVVRKHGSRPPLFLLDDLGAELDPDHQRHILNYLATAPIQSLLTLVSVDSAIALPPASKVFHVEQGRIKQ